jgi:HD-GYP domain-containing protein (c-di-GMP phosphodiesterase class II)
VSCFLTADRWRRHTAASFLQEAFLYEPDMSRIKGKPSFCVAGIEESAPAETPLAARLRAGALALGWQSRYVDVCRSDEIDETAAVVLVVEAGAESVRRHIPHSLLISESPDRGLDLVLPGAVADDALDALLCHGEAHLLRNHKMMALFREVGARRQRMSQLSDIALSLSTKMGYADLLETILREARGLAGCDAGSLYLIDESEDDPALVFKLAQNDSREFPFIEQRLPLTADSLAGYVAITGDELDIPDVYRLPEDAPFSFNRSFDDQMNYRTVSVLVLPMRDHRDEVVGVLQFINRLDPTRDEPIPFGEELVELLRAVASQAAVSIQKNLLIRDVNRLFESFVQASVRTIEQRDPSTSGHSFRVADTTVVLLETLPDSGLPRFRQLRFSPQHIKEVRYAALLHDFGKVAVRENVLLKANKLTDDRLELIRYRLELQRERLRRRAVERELELLHHDAVDNEVARRRVHRDLQAQLSLLSDYEQMVEQANQPSVLDASVADELREIRDYVYRELDGTLNGLITDQDLLALSVRKGSLTPDERREIQSHVTHTREFLDTLPWPPELANVPEIAGAHHEKLDGSGYPSGLIGEQIPLASRVMTVCDIYDALTAMDRPYKKAMPIERALSILGDEARQGLLDTDMVNVFIESRVYERIGASPAARRVV